MKHSFIFIFLILFVFISSAQTDQYFNASINPEKAKKYVSALADDSMMGRITGSKGNLAAAKYISRELESAGVLPLFDKNYLSPFSYSYNNKKDLIAYNVIALLPGKTRPDELIIFSAHYDHVGTASSNPYPKLNESKNRSDSIYNGANDDASGVSAVLMLANYFKALNNNERSLVFVFFSGEELGLKGSEALAANVDPQKIIADINIEMIGRESENSRHPYITGANISNLQSVLNKTLTATDKKYWRYSYFESDNYTTESLFTRSDNYSFAKKGIIAHSIMATSPQDEFYHSVKDEAGTLNYELVAKITAAIALGCKNIINGTVKLK